MTRLTHEQARRYLNDAADNCLNPGERTALEAHLTECSACRAYAAELNQLQATLGRALRARWKAPPINLVARVRRQVKLNTRRRLFLGFANTLVKLGALAAIVGMVAGLGLLQSRSLQTDQPLSAGNTNRVSLLKGVQLTSDLEIDSESPFALVGQPGIAEQWQTPALPSRLGIIQH